MDTNEHQTGLTNEEGIENSTQNTEIIIPKNESIVEETRLESIRYAGFWMRFWAYLLDIIIVGSLVRLLIKPFFRLLDVSLAETNMFAPISIASAIIFYLYFVLMTKYFNQTLGKMVFGIKVIDLKTGTLSWNTILFREWIGRFISATIIVGYIIVAFMPKKQGLHDLFTDTTVIHIDR
jgi:uncharacterized RDD family membrane protein YckC